MALLSLPMNGKWDAGIPCCQQPKKRRNYANADLFRYILNCKFHLPILCLIQNPSSQDLAVLSAAVTIHNSSGVMDLVLEVAGT